MPNQDELLRLIEEKTATLADRYTQLRKEKEQQELYIRELEAENLALRQALQEPSNSQQVPREQTDAPQVHADAPSNSAALLKKYIQELDQAIRWLEQS